MGLNLPKNFTEMLKSFVAMGRTLNLSRAASESDVARPTLRRHLQQLDELCQGNLFKLENQNYRLTDLGEKALPIAENLLRQSQRFFSPTSSKLGGLMHASIKLKDGWFHTQQHRLNDVWQRAPDTLKSGFENWSLSQGKLEHEKFRAVRDRTVVMRPQGGEWICVEIGERSVMANWLGWASAKSAIGLPILQNPASNEANQLLIDPIDHVAVFGGAWYDHVSARFPRPGAKESNSINYQRLVMHCSFPDQTPAVVSLVHTTNDIFIDGVDLDEQEATAMKQ